MSFKWILRANALFAALHLFALATFASIVGRQDVAA